MSKKAKWIVISLVTLLAIELVAACGIMFYLNPWKNAASTMPESGTMVLTCDQSGELTLTWPKGMDQDRYRVRVSKGDEMLMQIWVREESCILENLPEGENLAIVISTARGEAPRKGLYATFSMVMPKITQPTTDNAIASRGLLVAIKT